MSDRPFDTHAVTENLKRLRDELKVQFELGKMDAHDEWERLEGKWTDFAQEAELEKSAEDVGSAFSLLAEELEAGYKRLKKGL
jgi:hypothetical protein